MPPSSPATMTLAATGHAPSSDLAALANRTADEAHFLAGAVGDSAPAAPDSLAAQLLDSTKATFDRSLADEGRSLPLYRNLMEVMGVGQIETRAKKRKREDADHEAEQRALTLPTPLSELYTIEVGPEQIWEQLDMRSARLAKLLGRVVHGGYEATEMNDEDLPAGLDGIGSDEDEDDDDEEEDDSDDGSFEDSQMDEDLSGDARADSDEGEEYSYSLDGPATGPPWSSSPVSPKPGPSRLSIGNFDDPSTSLGARSPRRSGPRSAVDDDFFALDEFQNQADELAESRGLGDDDLGEDEVDLFAPVSGIGGDEDEDEAEDDDEGGPDLGATGDIMYADFFDPPPRPISSRGGKGKSPARKGRHERSDAPAPTSPAIFASSSQQPGPNGIDADEPVSADKSKRRVSFADEVRVKTIPSVGRGLNLQAAFATATAADDEEDEDGGEGISAFDDDDPESDEASEDDETEDVANPSGGLDLDKDADEDDDAASDTSDSAFERINNDLLADDADDDQSGAATLSRHEQRQAALAKQIAALEAENVADKAWTMKGETRSKERPLDSLLEEDLEFEHIGKVVPVVTEEMTATLEARIKKRILDGDFDDVVRRRAFDPAAYLPSRLLDIAGTRSDKSLADLYADEYSAERQRLEGTDIVHEVDAKLEREHGAITRMFDDVCAKLDALSNAHFTPKPPATEIVTVTNVPAISMESALPTTFAASSGGGGTLAPEEVHRAQQGALPAGRTELTPAERQAERQRRRKKRAADQQRVDRLAGSSASLVGAAGAPAKKGKGKGKQAARGGGGGKSEKSAALAKLVGTKGVSVIGKPSKKGSHEARAQEAAAKGGKAFKL